MYEHEWATLEHVARSLGRIMGLKFGGYHDGTSTAREVFCVPSETLLASQADGLNIRHETEFFGGMVATPLVGTKAINHRLVDREACHATDWPGEFEECVRDVVLPGYTVFSLEDARKAARRLLAIGPLRIKNPLSSGGGGQRKAATMAEVESRIESLATIDWTKSGLVMEANLRHVTTLSLGRIAIGNLRMAYHGTQSAALDNHGRSVYAGSDLVCVRGDWDALERLPLAAEVRLAVGQARTYDAAADRLPGFMASRRNYDICQGVDGSGRWHSGVLEASWRSGGASAAEVAAAEILQQDHATGIVEVSTVKKFGRHCEPPRGAILQYWADDPRDGPLLRYTVVNRTHRAL